MNEENQSRDKNRGEAQPKDHEHNERPSGKGHHRDESTPKEPRAIHDQPPDDPSRGDPATSDRSTGTTTDLARLQSELAEANSKAETYLDLAQRTQADFVNYKRRIEQERSDYARASRAEVILKVLPALDDLTRAVEHLPPELVDSDWARGVILIERKLRGALEGLGIKPIDVIGKPFDPWQQEAVMHEPRADAPPETVVGVARDGYTLDGRVIRPAQVIVSSGPPEDAS